VGTDRRFGSYVALGGLETVSAQIMRLLRPAVLSWLILRVNKVGLAPSVSAARECWKHMYFDLLDLGFGGARAACIAKCATCHHDPKVGHRNKTYNTDK
jgi:hypothetical protein